MFFDVKQNIVMPASIKNQLKAVKYPYCFHLNYGSVDYNVFVTCVLDNRIRCHSINTHLTCVNTVVLRDISFLLSSRLQASMQPPINKRVNDSRPTRYRNTRAGNHALYDFNGVSLFVCTFTICLLDKLSVKYLLRTFHK